MIPSGKVQFIWKPENFGTPSEVADYCADLGLSAVSIKVANGYLLYTHLTEYVEAIRSTGIKVGGWHYLYCGVYFPNGGSDYVLTGVTPEREADVSLQAIELYNLDFFEADAEKEFKVWDGAGRAERYLTRLLSGTSITVGLTSYRFPELHLDFPWASWFEMAGGVDYMIPQVYWQVPNGSTRGPLEELEESWNQFLELWIRLASPYDEAEFVPAGREYIGDGYPSPGPLGDQLTQFMSLAKNYGFPGVTFWALDFLKSHEGGTARADAIRRFEWGDPPEPPEPPEPIPHFVQISTTGAYVNLRPQPLAGSGLPTNGITYNGKRFEVVGEVVNERGERWLKVATYVAEWLTKPTE